MGKTKGYNWRARKVVDVKIDDRQTNSIQVDTTDYKNNNYDECNSLVLPSKKRNTKIKNDKPVTTKILSKSKRKKLEKVLERKEKKQNRASLLEALAKVQINEDELKQLTSVSAVQNKGLKRFQHELNAGVFPKKSDLSVRKISGTKGVLKRKNLQDAPASKKFRPKSDDPNIVGFDSELSEDEDKSQLSEEEDESDSEDNLDCEIEESVTQVEVNLDTEKLDVNSSSKNDIKPSQTSTVDHPPKIGNLKNSPLVTEVNKNINGIKDENKPAIFVHVDRKPEIQVARLKLPILAEEQIIMEKINYNQIIILAGETGSGKTTQIPQFLYEAGYAVDKLIGITEPRRVAAISMSKRVAEEMNLSPEEVSYLIRFEGNTTEKTKIKFMTDGVLLKELQSDFLLSKYSVIILDEAHERSVYTDILIGLLSRIVPLRYKRNNPLKLIIMSATLQIEDFTQNNRLFKIAPPVIKVDARQFPVTIHFNKRTNDDYLKEAFRKAAKIHNQLPAGGILIFVTGQREVNYLVRKLRRIFPMKFQSKQKKTTDIEINKSNESDDSEQEYYLGQTLKRDKIKRKVTLPDINLDDYILPIDEDVCSVTNSDLEEDSDNDDVTFTGNNQPLWTLPLYSLLPSYKQSRVFEPPPNDYRLCVVCTNVAETSLTIPNIKYVIDTGRTKVRLYDKITGVSMYQVTWVSKAAANQRAGRSGRMGPGHCYRLYSSAVFNDVFRDFSIPEIQQKPVDDLYLQMKCMNIDKIINFPFPSAPDLLQLKTAEGCLIKLGALEIQNKTNAKVTALGQAMSKFPVLPRFGKMLALSHQKNLLPYTICLVAALSVPEVLLETPIFQNDVNVKQLRQRWIQLRRSWASSGHSLLLGDPMILLRAVGAAEFANSTGSLENFCNENGLRHKAVLEIRKLRIQLTNEIKANMPNLDIIVDPQMKPPNDLEAKLLRQILLSGMADKVAKKVDISEIKDNMEKSKYKHAYKCPNMDEPVFLHSNSVLRKHNPEWVVYQEIYETNKMYMRGVTAIEPEWLPIYAAKSCNLNKPLAEPPPRYEPSLGKILCTVTGSFGQQSWQLPTVEIPYPDNVHKYKWVACFFLQGQIFPQLQKYCKALLSSPSIMTKTWAHLQPRTEVLLKTLLSRQVDSKSKIEEVWEKEPEYLLSAYKLWLPESAHNEVTLLWPPISNNL